MNLPIEKYSYFSASVSCMDLLNLSAQMQEVESAGINFYHYDVVDGMFGRCLMLGDELLRQMKKQTKLPIEVHLAVTNPLLYIPIFAQCGADYIGFHYESTQDPHIIVAQILKLGAKPVLAYQSNTPPGEDFIGIAEKCVWITKLTVEPGFSGQTMRKESISHIQMMQNMMNASGINRPIQADGNVNASTISQMHQAGASIFTGGTSGLFVRNTSINDSLAKLKGQLQEQ